MTAAVVLGVEEDVHEELRLVFADDAGAEGDHVGVVVLAGQAHGQAVGGVDAADAGDAVGGKGNAETLPPPLPNNYLH